jgi:dissimilatory sulfite reductase (desulfoviridin) alpha/beta subunit
LAVGQFELKNGYLFVLAEAAGGIYNGSQLRLICDVADDVSVFLKVTEDQRIGFMVPKEKLLELHAKLAKSGILLKHYRNHSILSPKACLGELCSKCEQDALGDAIDISPFLNEKFKDSFTALNIGMNGCAVACVASATDDIHIVGDSQGYNMSIGGRTSGEPKLAESVIEGIPRSNIGTAISLVLETYSQNKQGAENLSDVVSRIGLQTFKEVLEKNQITSAQAVPAATEDAAPAAEGMEESLEVAPEEPVVGDAAPAAEGVDESLEVAPEEPVVGDAAPAAEGVDESLEVAPEEPLAAEAVPTEDTPDEETPLDVSNSEPLVSEASSEAAILESDSASAEESTDASPVSAEDEIAIDDASGGNEAMSDKEIAVEEGAVSAETENSSAEIKDLEIVDDTAEGAHSSSESSDPQPVDHGMGDDDPTGKGGASAVSDNSGDEVAPIGLDEDADPSHIPTSNKKTSIQVKGNYFSVTLSDGSDFTIPFKTIEPGKIIEMQIEDETFLIENIDGKLQVKYGEFEIHVPFSHGAAGLESDDTDSAA